MNDLASPEELTELKDKIEQLILSSGAEQDRLVSLISDEYLTAYYHLFGRVAITGDSSPLDINIYIELDRHGNVTYAINTERRFSELTRKADIVITESVRENDNDLVATQDLKFLKFIIDSVAGIH